MGPSAVHLSPDSELIAEIEWGKYMSEAASKTIGTFLEPVERIAEILFCVIMTLTFTCTLAVEAADRLQVRTMQRKRGKKARQARK
jgi:hypothetical protein